MCTRGTEIWLKVRVKLVRVIAPRERTEGAIGTDRQIPFSGISRSFRR